MRRFAGIAWLLIGVLALLWGWQQWRVGSEREALRRQLQDPAQRLNSEELVLRETEFLVRFAAAAENELLPPDYARAEALLAEAIHRSPARGALWIQLARVKLFTGRSDEARAALMTADRLAPNAPRPRMEAITLWALLGETERAAKLAEELVRLDPMITADVARQLRLAGFAPVDVLARLGGVAVDPRHTLTLLQVLGSPGSGHQERLVAALDQDLLNDPPIRRQAALMLMNPLRAEPLMELWRRETNAELVTITPGSLTLLHNLDLKLGTPATENRFPLGWQPPPRGAFLIGGFTTVSDQTTTAPLVVRLHADTFGADSARELTWEFYRFVLRKDEAWEHTFAARSEPRDSARIQLRAQWNGGEARSATSDHGTEDWQQLSLRLDAQPQDRLVTLAVLRRERLGGRSGSGRVWLAPRIDHPLLSSLQTISDSEGKNRSTIP